MPKKILLLDCARAYADPLAAAFAENGARIFRMQTDEPLAKFTELLSRADGVAVSGTDFSPGNSRTKRMTPRLRDAQKSIPFLRAAIAKRRPILGICHGFQMLVALFGGTLSRQAEPEEGIFSTRVIRDDPLFRGLPLEFGAFKWRRWFVEKVSPDFVPLAVSAESVDVARHAELPFVGVQFHPEIKKRGNRAQRVLKNWLDEL